MARIPKDKVNKDDINSVLLQIHELLEERFDLTPEELDNLAFDALERVLDKFFNYPDYGNYN